MLSRLFVNPRSLEVKGVLNDYYAQVRKQDYLKKSIELLRGMWSLRSSSNLMYSYIQVLVQSHPYIYRSVNVHCSQSAH